LHLQNGLNFKVLILFYYILVQIVGSILCKSLNLVEIRFISPEMQNMHSYLKTDCDQLDLRQLHQIMTESQVGTVFF